MAKAVIFDIDGTLVNSVDQHALAWQDTLRHFGKETGFEEVREQINQSGDQLMSVFLTPDQVERHGNDIKRYRKDLFHWKYLWQVRPFPQVRELCERLVLDGYQIALASSGQERDWDAYRDLINIDDLLDTGDFFSEENQLEPDVFRAAFHRLGDVYRDEVIAVADTCCDVEAAGRAGLRSIGLLCGGASEEQLRRAGCRDVYRNPAELLKRYHLSLLAEAEMY